MNLLNKCTTEELQSLKDIGINIEDKEYSKTELRKLEDNIEDFIMSHSTKNGDFDRLTNQYNGILNAIIDEK